MENRKISAKEYRILEQLLIFIDKNGFSPTVRELGEILGYRSSSTVHHHLQSLQEKGIISYEPTKSRTLRIVGCTHLNWVS